MCWDSCQSTIASIKSRLLALAKQGIQKRISYSITIGIYHIYNAISIEIQRFRKSVAICICIEKPGNAITINICSKIVCDRFIRPGSEVAIYKAAITPDI